MFSLLHSLKTLKDPCVLFCAIAFLLFFSLNNAASQNIDISSKPSWVIEKLVPFQSIDSLGYRKKTDRCTYFGCYIYQEIQINADTEEYFNKRAFLIDDVHDEDIKLEHSPKDLERQLVDVTKRNGLEEVSVLEKVNWIETESKEYVVNRLWESKKTMEFTINKRDVGEIYALSFLDKLKREDIKAEDVIFYSVYDSTHIYFRVLSSSPLNFKTFNGFPDVKVYKHEDHYEYVAEGFAITPYKGKTPDDFISIPFVCLSKFESLEQMGAIFSKYFQTDKQSDQALDELYSSLIDDESSDSIKIQKIINYVQDTIIYQNYGLYKSYEPYWCIKGNRGDCKAKSLIAVELLKRANIDAYPVLVRYPKYLYQLDDLPTPISFNHAIVQYVLGENTIYFDPTIPNQTDKIGAYPIPSYGKSLVLNKDGVNCVNISDESRGEIEVIDYISDRVKRKIILTGGFAEKYKNNNLSGPGENSIFKGFYFYISRIANPIHLFDTGYRNRTETDLTENTYNSISQDSIVLTQELVKNDSVKQPILATDRRYLRFMSGFSSSVDINNSKDTLYRGEWPLDYINQSTTATYDKYKIPLIDLNLDTFDTDFLLENTFGRYHCTIEETDEAVIVKQNTFVSGSLSLEQIHEYDDFLVMMKEHQRAVKSLLLAKDVTKSEGTIEISEKRKRRRRKSN